MKTKIKHGFTIVEVSILFIIFLIVAFLVAPLSLDDKAQSNNTSRWRSVQGDFINIAYSINTQKDNEDFDYIKTFNMVMNGEVKDTTEPYKITYMNGTFPSGTYYFTDFKQTYSNATVAYKFFETPQDGIYGIMMYDVNGQLGPNVWGKDVFGFNIYPDKFEPFGKNISVAEQRQDCAKTGTGLYCSNCYLVGGCQN